MCIRDRNEEQTQLAGEVDGYKERLSALQEDVKILRDVRHWLNQVLPSEPVSYTHLDVYKRQLPRSS